jgi:primosomal protein N' (replication factor Y) (superfamily II helicase)
MKNDKSQHLISVAPLTRIALTRDQSFFYTFSRTLFPGTLVEIPMGKRVIEGIVTDSTPDFPRESNYQIRKIHCIVEDNFLTREQLALAKFISSHYIAPLGIVLKHFISQKVTARTRVQQRKNQIKKVITNREQDMIIKKLDHHGFRSFFLHSLSQSDKIGILFSLMQQKMQKNDGQILYLLPELIQTPYVTQFLHSFFPSESIAILHSKLTKGQFYDQWQKIRNGSVSLIIGTRIASFAPFKDLNLIVVDEAHDMSHKQWDHTPLFDTRTITTELARLHKCCHILTSSVPRAIDYVLKDNSSATTTFIVHNTIKKPLIEIVDMKKERWDKNTSPISRALYREINSTLHKRRQAIIFVNRQGLSFFSICSKCRKVLKCPHCEHALIPTKQKSDLCVHCHKSIPSSKKCYVCKSPMEHVGIGTEKIYTELKKRFPKARIAIVDSSTMQGKGAHQKVYESFSDHKIDIIIGTQMITKKWYTNHVHLSAIIDTENLLSNPDYLTNERTFAFVIQMALRTDHGKLLVQTFQPEHPVITYAHKFDFAAFYKEELTLRRALHFPPYARMIKLTYKNKVKKDTETNVQKVYDELSTLLTDHKKVILSEPHFPLVDKIRSQYRKQMIIKVQQNDLPQELYNYLCSLDTKWIIDVDPVQTS